MLGVLLRATKRGKGVANENCFGLFLDLFNPLGHICCFFFNYSVIDNLAMLEKSLPHVSQHQC